MGLAAVESGAGLARNLLIPGAGIEPARIASADFKSGVRGFSTKNQRFTVRFRFPETMLFQRRGSIWGSAPSVANQLQEG